jgi:papilin
LCLAICLLPKISGNCGETIESWFYDFKQGECKKFNYSGCNGNLNRFSSSEICEYTCQGLNIIDKSNELIEKVCHSPKIPGICHLKLQRWYFNKTTSMCHQFTYSGD